MLLFPKGPQFSLALAGACLPATSAQLPLVTPKILEFIEGRDVTTTPHSWNPCIQPI